MGIRNLAVYRPGQSVRTKTSGIMGAAMALPLSHYPLLEIDKSLSLGLAELDVNELAPPF